MIFSTIGGEVEEGFFSNKKLLSDMMFLSFVF